LICFPHAGGGASLYNGWGALLPEVEVCAVRLPGRERRIREAPLGEMSALLDALGPGLAPLLDKPFALVGYSMGAGIATAFAQRLQAREGPLPRGLLALAAGAPHLPRPSHDALDDAGFIEVLRSYEGTPPEVLEHRELMELVLPVLRADFALADTVLPAEPLRCPISVWSATEDSHVTGERLAGWRELTRECRGRQFPGGHFFIRTAWEQVVAALREELPGWFPAGL